MLLESLFENFIEYVCLRNCSWGSWHQQASELLRHFHGEIDKVNLQSYWACRDGILSVSPHNHVFLGSKLWLFPCCYTSFLIKNWVPWQCDSWIYIGDLTTMVYEHKLYYYTMLYKMVRACVIFQKCQPPPLLQLSSSNMAVCITNMHVDLMNNWTAWHL